MEVFNLNLVRDLASLGCVLSVVCHSTWREVIRGWINEDDSVEVLSPPSAGMDLLAGLLAAGKLAGRRFAVLLLANVANRLIPAMHLLRHRGVCERCVLIAHREPSARSLRAQKAWPSTVLAVNAQIASHFKGIGIGDVAVHYGITDADLFFPAERAGQKGGADFCVLGYLDSAWKGADTAIAAFRAMDPELRDCSRLHLASFADPPTFPEENIRTYPWIPFKEMPEFLRSMDVMLVPSRDELVMRETFSQAMVQGMLTALPAVVSDLPVLAEKLDRGGGLICKELSDYSDAMNRLASDEDLRLREGGAARETALARYVWKSDVFFRRFLFPGPDEAAG